MGDPRRNKKSFSKPAHPWQRERIEEERTLLHEYGLKNKRELWKAGSTLKNFATQAKQLIAATGTQAEREKAQLFQKLERLGLLKKDAKLDDILILTPKDILERRLQTLVFRKGLARSVTQARQFITHEHIMAANNVITAPGYLVSVGEEPAITFTQLSSLASPEHSERVPIEKKVKKRKPREDMDRRGRRPMRREYGRR